MCKASQNCLICGKRNPPSKRKPRMYCSSNCAWKAYYYRHHEESKRSGNERTKKYYKNKRLKEPGFFAVKRRENEKYQKEQKERIKQFHERHPDYHKIMNKKERKKPDWSRRNTIRSYDNRHAKREKCELCGSTEDLELHHLTYERGNYKVLCMPCHKKCHRKYGGVTYVPSL